jgi:hypothetical protein
MSKKKNKDRAKLPPKDSWISLKPGTSVVINAEFQDKWRRTAATFRQIRGTVLAAAFEIEFALDAVLRETYFPALDTPDLEAADSPPVTVESMRVVRDLFDEYILKGVVPMIGSFSFKIRLLEELMSGLPALHDSAPHGLVKNLDRVRKIRNKFAHYPVAFEPVGDAPDQELSAELACGDGPTRLDQPFLDECSKLFGSTVNGLEEMLQALRSNTSRT